MTPDQFRAEIAIRIPPTSNPLTRKTTAEVLKEPLGIKWWEEFKYKFLKSQVKSFKTSKTGNVHEMRLKNGVLTHRISKSSYDLWADVIGRMLVKMADSTDASWMDVLGEIFKRVQQQGEYPNHYLAVVVCCMDAILEDPEMYAKLDEIITKFQGYVGSADTLNIKTQHERNKAIKGMVPHVQAFLQNNGTYEELVELLQRELVAVVQNE